jgi:hypothetical protein
VGLDTGTPGETLLEIWSGGYVLVEDEKESRGTGKSTQGFDWFRCQSVISHVHFSHIALETVCVTKLGKLVPTTLRGRT